MNHRSRVTCRNGIWEAHCPDCGGRSPFPGRGEDFREIVLRDAQEHFHEYNCADPDHDCRVQRQRRSRENWVRTMRMLHAARRAGPPRRGITGWLRNRRFWKIFEEFPS